MWLNLCSSEAQFESVQSQIFWDYSAVSVPMVRLLYFKLLFLTNKVLCQYICYFVTDICELYLRLNWVLQSISHILHQNDTLNELLFCLVLNLEIHSIYL